MGGKPSFLVMNQSSVIIFQIDVNGIAFDPNRMSCASFRWR
jgi:hypothetical protein